MTSTSELQTTSSVISVTVTDASGATVLEANDISPGSNTVKDLRGRVQALKPGLLTVQLLSGDKELHDTDTLEGTRLEISAVFGREMTGYALPWAACKKPEGFRGHYDGFNDHSVYGDLPDKIVSALFAIAERAKEHCHMNSTPGEHMLHFYSFDQKVPPKVSADGMTITTGWVLKEVDLTKDYYKRLGHYDIETGMVKLD